MFTVFRYRAFVWYFRNNHPIQEYIGGTGRKDGLSVIMNANPDDYFSTTDPFYGVKVRTFYIIKTI